MNVWIRNALPALLAGFVAGACSDVTSLNNRRWVAEFEDSERIRWPSVDADKIVGRAHGGGKAAVRFGGACEGAIPAKPQHVLRLDEASEIRLVARSQNGSDLVLVVHGKDSTFCSDDYDFSDPGFQLRLKPGDYAVYVGTHELGSLDVPYTLELSRADERGAIRGLSLSDLETEVASLVVPVSAVVSEHRQALEARISRFESELPGRNVGPVPRFDRGTKHGSVTIFEETLLPLAVELDVEGRSAIWQVVGPCAGFVDPLSPTLRLSLRWAMPSIVLTAISEVDTSIIVRDAQGTWYCNDDANGSKDPELRLNSPSIGELLVWIGAVETRQSYPATIYIGEGE